MPRSKRSSTVRVAPITRGRPRSTQPANQPITVPPPVLSTSTVTLPIAATTTTNLPSSGSSQSLPPQQAVRDLSVQEFLALIRTEVQQQMSSTTSVNSVPAAITPNIGTVGSPLLSGLQHGGMPPIQLVPNMPLTVPPTMSSTTPLPPQSAMPAQFSGLLGQHNSTNLSLSIASDPIPAKLVDRIRSGAFVDMRDLLSDNVSLMRHYDTFQGAVPIHVLPGSARPRIREVTTLPSWICAFLTYLAVRTTDPLTRDQLTYAWLVIREHLRHGGQGWLEYDRLFRQQAALDRTLQWNTIQPALQATTILGQRVGGGVTCTICHECDHTASQCAMAYVQQPLVSATRHQTRLMPRRSARPTPVCISWNEGSCCFPGTCTFRHICSNCNHPHRAKDCRDTQRPRSSRPASPPPPRPPSSR